MNSQTRRVTVAGPAGALECAIDSPSGEARALAVVCHPHPLQGGTMDNKVAQTLARALVQVGCLSVRFNYRGVGASQGSWDEGRGEVDDALSVVETFRAQVAGDGAAELVLAGFSFGGYVAASAAQRLPEAQRPRRMVLVGPAVRTFDTPSVPAGTLVIHGEHDDVVPLTATLDWARPQSLPVTVFPGTGHFFHGQLLQLRDIVIRGMR
jgi:alpha/beta superfamily hydrolase